MTRGPLTSSPAGTSAPLSSQFDSRIDGSRAAGPANTSRKQGARQAIQELQGGKAKVLGAVLNQRKFPIPQALYKLF